MFITPSFKKSLIVEQFQGNYLNRYLANKKPADQTFYLETKETSYPEKTRFLVNQRGLSEDFEKSDIISSINSDHSAIILHFSSISKQKYSQSFCKFNASLTEDMN